MLPKPLYHELCGIPARCNPCDKFLGYYVNETNARNALKAHASAVGCGVVLKPKPKPKAKGKTTLKVKPTYLTSCPCGWVSQPAPNKIDAIAQHAGHLLDSPSCIPRAMDMELIKK